MGRVRRNKFLATFPFYFILLLEFLEVTFFQEISHSEYISGYLRSMANLNVSLSVNKSLDLKSAPHGLIAGQTGSGKSVCINSILTSLISQNSPNELKLILIDPKVVELMPYSDIPHLQFPIITESGKAIKALNWAVQEMESRYQKLALNGSRNLETYNQKVSQESQIPSIVIVIDEFADLMYQAKKDIEIQIIRIAQKARAVGIHLILATQRPSVNVITGILKANIPTRICFQVASQIDARTVMDTMGAEKLKGKGEFLLKENGISEIEKYQGTYISESEVEDIVNQIIVKYESISQVQISSPNENNDTQNILDLVIQKCDLRRARICRRF